MKPSAGSNARVALVMGALFATVLAIPWLNQGPSQRAYDRMTQTPRAEMSIATRAWLPLAFVYRRSADEELYFAVANAIRGKPYDLELLRAKRGDSSDAFRRGPPCDGRFHTPYGEVPFEYPLVLLPFVLLPGMLSPSFEVFAILFGGLMGALSLAAAVIAAWADPSADTACRARGMWTAAALFLAQGGLLVQRVDAVVALFLSVALWAAIRRRPIALGAALGLAGAAKIVPALIAWPMVASDRAAVRRRGVRARLLVGGALGVGFGLLPMFAMSARGSIDFFRYHAARGLHIESTYGAFLSLASLLSGHPLPATLSYGSFNLNGSVASVFARASGPLLALAVGATGFYLASAPTTHSDRERTRSLALGGLAGLTCLWLFNKVFSPQYLTWGIPFAVASDCRKASFALAAAMAIGQLYLRGFYDLVVTMRPLGVAALLLRVAALVALAILSSRARHPTQAQIASAGPPMRNPCREP